MGLTNNKTSFAIGVASLTTALLPEVAQAIDVSDVLKTGEIGLGGGFGLSLGPEAGGIAQALCEIVSWFQGGLGQSIASLAIIFLGIGAFFGKVTWGTALLVAVGVFAIFGSGEIVSVITNGKATGCCGGLNVALNTPIPGVGASACVDTQF